MKKEKFSYRYTINWEYLKGKDIAEWIAAIACLIQLMDISIDRDLYEKLEDKAKRYFKPNL